MILPQAPCIPEPLCWISDAGISQRASLSMAQPYGRPGPPLTDREARQFSTVQSTSSP